VKEAAHLHLVWKFKSAWILICSGTGAAVKISFPLRLDSVTVVCTLRCLHSYCDQSQVSSQCCGPLGDVTLHCQYAL
jgi:hypothetical protein